MAIIAYVLDAAQIMALETGGMSNPSKTACEMCSASLSHSECAHVMISYTICLSKRVRGLMATAHNHSIMPR